ncbi:MAG TPA: hypothetical protein DCS93_31875 [Microscillaceae bacterium]|nr:hypothetical protein [Microscillaceae bacterium]
MDLYIRDLSEENLVFMQETSKKYTIPPRDREEWKMIVTGEIKHYFKNFVLQMKSNEYKRKIENGTLTPDEATDDLYQLCEKYAIAVQNDFKIIFKEW